MAFPVNGILDNFNRANEGPPPSTSWSNLSPTDFTGTFAVVSNVAAVTGVAAIYWNPTTFGPNCEAYATLATTGEAYVFARIQSPGSTNWDGYAVEWTGPGSILLHRVDNDTFTQIGGSTGHTQNVGDKFGIEIVGTTINSWRFQSAAWTNDLSIVDTAYQSAGYIGYAAVATGVGNFDDFGGGALAGGGPPQVLQPYVRIAGAA